MMRSFSLILLALIVLTSMEGCGGKAVYFGEPGIRVIAETAANVQAQNVDSWEPDSQTAKDYWQLGDNLRVLGNDFVTKDSIDIDHARSLIEAVLKIEDPYSSVMVIGANSVLKLVDKLSEEEAEDARIMLSVFCLTASERIIEILEQRVPE